jgi:aarF domain-containing kinase
VLRARYVGHVFMFKAMLDAQLNSLMYLAEPLSPNKDVFDFTGQDISGRVRENLPTLLRERLAPPPTESYSIHRKLSGLFLLFGKLGARIPCSKIFAEYA